MRKHEDNSNHLSSQVCILHEFHYLDCLVHPDPFDPLGTVACSIYLNMNVSPSSRLHSPLLHCLSLQNQGLLGPLKIKMPQIDGRHIPRIFWSRARTEINALDWPLRKQQRSLQRFKKKLPN